MKTYFAKIVSLLQVSSLALLGCLLLITSPAYSNNQLSFEQLYGKYSVTGLEFSDKVKALSGKEVTIQGFMAPPLKVESQFFVLTKAPMAICPFCSSDADWPEDILVVYLKKRQSFVQFNTIIEVKGILEHGMFVDPDTGFVSMLRLREATFNSL
ncbi:hypothetical protein C8D76_10829 [Pasteurella langaaensis DSM 22999]|uniref:DUF3299 domain-containing protein n=1 Tax=Alitibacter langaaensis DSM 22999 TaxID=1122935 RepID=A0A2U0SQ10_9PAST|nr:hypothetical protein [Pasteurella langaaensis]PVX33445.1 hypothetical protein C8D76_10829 [Pasteurella langaaensis DSM 22999]